MSLKTIVADFRKQLRVYRAAAAHPRTPRLAKWCLVAAIAYALMPFDLIPDFIPVVGHLDDLLVIPALVALALWMIPADVLAECRQSSDRSLHT
jgi:uncharacterized membrane protein YkvA (DUF1232 family)